MKQAFASNSTRNDHRVSPHAFVDESRRASYLLVAALVETNDLVRLRTLMRGLRVAGERRLHFKSESDAVKKDVVGRLVDAGVRTRIYVGRGHSEAARQVCLARLVEDLLDLGARRMLLDSRGHEEDFLDRRVVVNVLQRRGVGSDRLVYEHLASHGDAALWVPDAVAWCYGAGGEWKRRVAGLVEEVVDIGTATRRQQIKR
jgi:hypothetical protein